MKVDLEATAKAIEHITGGWRAQMIYVAAKLGIPDLIAGGVTSSADLAAATGSKQDGVHRMMRLLVAMGVFTGDEAEGYANTPVSLTLTSHPDSLRDMCLLYGEEFYTAWGQAVHAITTVSSGYEQSFGEPLYAHLGKHPDLATRFQGAMKAGNLFFDYVPEVYDFDGKTVVDVGGGNGSLLAAILGAAPGARGVLIDQPHVVPIARANLEATVGLDRVEVVGGDMHEAVPQGGDVYLLCRVLAGHSDDSIAEVFERCRLAMRGPESRLIILERTVRDDHSTVLPALWDLHLLMTNGGKHRSLRLFDSLLTRAGLVIERVAELPMETSAVIARAAA